MGSVLFTGRMKDLATRSRPKPTAICCCAWPRSSITRPPATAPRQRSHQSRASPADAAAIFLRSDLDARVKDRWPMILTPIDRDDLAGALDRFGVGLRDAFSARVFRRIRSTSPDRAAGPAAERHRLAALAFARRQGMA